MLLIALAFVIVPLWRSRPNNSTALTDASSNLAVFRSQKNEIEEDFARGVINATERDAAIGELSQRLLDEVPGGLDRAEGTQRPARAWRWIATVGLLMPAAALTMYAFVGSPKALDPANRMAVAAAPGQETAAAPGGEPPVSDKQILAMVDTLAQKMRENPSDPKGWVLLARSQSALGRFPAAAEAFEQATKLLPNDAQLMADYADTMVMAQDGRFEGKPLALIQQTLKIDPNNLKGLALAGTAQMRLGNREESLKQWEKLKSLVAPGSDDLRQVEAIIAEVRSGKSPIAPAAPAPQPVVVAPAAPPVQAPAAAVPPVAAKAGKSITGSVTIAPELTAKLAPTDILYVFARAKDGPRMPLAVWRIAVPKAAEFPKSFELTDAMAMSPGMSLSSFPEVVIEGRISKSGNAPLQSGDFLGVSEPVKPGATNVRVTISKVAP